MKNLAALILILMSISRSYAQPDPRLAKQEMNRFSGWPGVWKGESVSQMGPTTKRSFVEEQIQSKLDGTLILFEGSGKAIDSVTHQEKVVHHALGLLAYDVGNKQFKMKSYLADGRSTDAWFTVLGENHYQWGFDANPGKIRYTITINAEVNTWNEVGEYSRDGSEFKKFFEMNLVKQ